MPMTYEDWMAAAAEEYERLRRLLIQLEPDEWSRPTDCSEWDVREMVSHLVGAAESTASVREMTRQAIRGHQVRRLGDLIDKMNALQVLERAHHDGPHLVGELIDAGRRGVAARARLPRPVRALRIPFGPPLGVRPLGYLMGSIYTRDAWLHRVDISRATARPLALTAEHDGRIVDDVVQEWAATHGSSFSLELTGPAGGRWERGSGGPTLRLDAVDMCRCLSGRAEADGLLAVSVPF
ncbi:MAG: maleylpyruvate isomerase family mycothiol-dependent enzyme [Nocardioidaceae bacterium]